MKKIILLFIGMIALFLVGIFTLSLSAEKNTYAEFSSESATCQINPDAFIYILNMSMVCTDNPDYLAIQFQGLANGFAVGNGKYIVTAAHCLEKVENSPLGLRQPIVISPYYGDLFEARIVAVDKTNDVAILEVQWDAHPALELETAEEWKNGKTIKIAGYPPPPAERGGAGVFSHKIMIEETRLRNVNGNGATEIQLGSVNYPGKGWSGSPLINPETGKVVGLLTQERYQEKWFILKEHLIMGCSVDSIKRLFSKDHLHEGVVGTLTSSLGATKRFKQILGALDETVAPKNNQYLLIKNLCEDSPYSYLSHLLAGWVSSPAGEPYLLKAIEIAPNSTLLRATYGRNLMAQGEYKEAVEQFQAVTDRHPDHLFANYGLLVSLARVDLQSAEALGEAFTVRWPENGIFWFEYSKILRAQKKYNDQLPAIQKAIELCADVPFLYQRHLAGALMANGQHKESEQAFLELLKTHECERCWQAYAALLTQMGPDKTNLAEEATAKAKAFKAEQTVVN